VKGDVVKTLRHVAPWALLALVALGPTMARGIQGIIHDGAISGRIFDNSTNEGIPGMTVKLTPPRASALPQIVLRTDSDGRFDFGKVEKSRYLLQVYQGATLLYRRVIDNSEDSHFVVSLRPKPA
jgi:hypothetical protein